MVSTLVRGNKNNSVGSAVFPVEKEFSELLWTHQSKAFVFFITVGCEHVCCKTWPLFSPLSIPRSQTKENVVLVE
jgi:hypothetical protein